MKKKPIAVFITDTHLSDNNHEENKSIYRQAIALAKKLKLSAVDHGGDLFHSRKAQTQRNLNCLGEIFAMFQEAGVDLNVVVGNHDKTEYSIPDSFLDTYVYHPNVNIYRYGGGRPLEGAVYLNYVSYFSDEEYVAYFKTLKKGDGKKQVLLTHIGVDGAVMNNGVAVATKVTRELFKNFDKVFVGHYHDAQAISDKIFYIGAAMQHNFGEKPVKGATILYSDLSTELHEFDFPKYLAYKIPAKDLTLKDIEDLRVAAKEHGDNLRVVLTGTKAEIDTIDRQRLLIVGVDVTTEQELIEREDIEETVVAFTDITILEAFKDFCKKNKLKEKEGLKYLNQIIC